MSPSTPSSPSIPPYGTELDDGTVVVSDAVEPIDIDLVRHKFGALRDALRSELYEREPEIDAIQVALVSGTHVLCLGEPGVAKTMQYDRTVARIDGGVHFATQLRKTLPPEALFGPVDLPGLKERRFEFVTDNFLPDTDTARLDECFKANGSSLNSMLEVLNERRFTNGNRVMTCRLHTAFLASNEMPAHDAEENLRAFWDRIDQRLVTGAPADAASWRAIAQLEIDPDPPKVITWAEVLAAHADARVLPISVEVWDALDEIRRKLADESITMSPRRFNRAKHLARARAWLDGAAEVAAVHLEPLVNALWDEPEQARTVERVVLAVTSPGQKAALALADAIVEYADSVATVVGLDPDKRGKEPNILFEKAKRLRVEIDDAVPSLSGRARRTVEDADKTFMKAHRHLLIECFAMDPDILKGLD